MLTPQVLVVSSTATCSAIRQFSLEQAGYTVRTAFDISSALDAVAGRRFDAAIVDSFFADEDAKDLLLVLRSKAIPSVLIAPFHAPADLKSLADIELHIEDAAWLIRAVSSLLETAESRRKVAVVSLGLGKETVRVGEHLSWLVADDRQFEAAVCFLEEGFRQGDAGIIYGSPSDDERISRILSAHGWGRRDLISKNKLILIDAASMIALGEDWMHKAREIITSFPSTVRILGCGVTQVCWPSEESFFEYEAQVDRAIQGTRAIVVCLYEVGKITATQLLYGGLARHISVVMSDRVIREHSFFERRAA